MYKRQRLDRAWGIESRALLATLPFAQADEPELRELRGELAAWDAASVAPSSFLIFAMHNDLHPAIRVYLLGMVSARLGDLAGAAARSAELARGAPGDGGLADCLAAELAATVARASGGAGEALASRGAGEALASGGAGEALAILERSRPRLWFQLTVASPFFSLASRRFLQAELLREAGRLEEAAGWYQSIAQRSPYELVYRAAARERLAEIVHLSS